MTSLLGERLKHFSVEELLGEGGMGAVYRARDTVLERDVALKVIHPELAADEHHRRRLLREARAIAAVSHPHIATIYESGQDDGRLYIVMELIPGRSLRDHLGEGSLPPRRAVEIARQIASALERAHQAGVVHRDLKPDNVILGPDGAKVLDFGIAHRGTAAPRSRAQRAEADTALTAEGSVVGTPGYMSPEQALGLAVDHRTDLFSVGVLLYEMVSGALPFEAGTPVAAAAAVSRDEPTPLIEHATEAPDEVACLQEVIDRCLQKAPDDRYDDAADLAAALDCAADRLHALPQPEVRSGVSPFRASPEVGRAKRPPAPPCDVTVEPTLVAGGVALPQRSRAWLGALALLALLPVAYLVLREPPPREGAAPSATVGGQTTAEPTAVPITSLPAPSSAVPAARSAHQRALQAFRDANWLGAKAALEEAVEHDPSLATAHLRLALIYAMMHRTREARSAYGKAAQLRSVLAERDRVLLDALEPFIARDPSDLRVFAERLATASSRYPQDAELTLLSAAAQLRLGDLDAGAEAARRAVAIDPDYADGWQTLANALRPQGKVDEALLALERCIALTPASTDCLSERMRILSTRGDCRAVVRDARQAIARGAEGGYTHRRLASALATLGEPSAAVEEVLRQGLAQVDEAHRPQRELTDRLDLLSRAGDFAAAAPLAQSLIELSGGNEHRYADAVTRLIALHLESGHPERAVEAAEDYLARRAALSAPPIFDVLSDPTPTMLRVLHAGGELDDAELALQRRRWKDDWVERGASATKIWLQGDVRVAQTQTQARAALAARPAELVMASASLLGYTQASVGQLELIAGNHERAAELCGAASRECRALSDPIEHLRAHLCLGQALESRGDVAAACDAYGAVIAAWREAKPRSISAALAARRAANAGCRDRPPP